MSARNGELVVIAVRTLALEDALRLVIATGGRVDALAIAEWEVQRLRSSCERALGTRGRAYDRGPGGAAPQPPEDET